MDEELISRAVPVLGPRLWPGLLGFLPIARTGPLQSSLVRQRKKGIGTAHVTFGARCSRNSPRADMTHPQLGD
jgi:hypothetical protein